MKNRIKPSGAKVAGAETALKRLRDDFDRDFGQVRDQLGAHRQDLGLVKLLELWNSVDQASTTLLVEDGDEAWAALAGEAPAIVPALRDSPALRDPGIEAAFAQGPEDERVEYTMDTLGLALKNTVTMIHMPGLQERTGQVVSIRRIIEELAEMLSLTTNPDVRTVLLSHLVVETFNLLETLYPSVRVSAPGRGPVTFHEVLLTEGEQAAADALAAREATLDQAALARLREVRDHIAAHVDTRLPLQECLAQLYALSDDDLNGPIETAYGGFMDALGHIPFLARMVAIDGSRLNYVIGVEPTDGIVPFDS